MVRPMILLVAINVAAVWFNQILNLDFLGQIVVDLTQVPLTGTSVWRTLQPRQGKSDTGISGVIRLSLTSLGEAKIPSVIQLTGN
jgi:hypothetical protein